MDTNEEGKREGEQCQRNGEGGVIDMKGKWQAKRWVCKEEEKSQRERENYYWMRNVGEKEKALEGDEDKKKREHTV